MKLRKLMLCLLASVVISGMSGIHAYAAEETVPTAYTTVVAGETADTTQETNTDLIENDDTQAEVTEAAVDTEEDTSENKDSDKKATDTKKETKKTETKDVSYTKAELRLLSALIYCESNGQPYAGKLAVGIVVVNRMESKLFPGTLKGVVYQKYQFGPARNGSLVKALSEYDKGNFTSDSEKACIKAAKEALSGTKSVTYNGKGINMKSYLYFSGYVSNARLTIAGHQFK